MKEILLFGIVILLYLILNILATTSNIPPQKECNEFKDWQAQYTPARCLNHFINTP